MCGIFAYFGTSSSAAKTVFTGLKDLEYRGYDSWGIAALSDHQLFLTKKTGPLPSSAPQLPKSTIAIGHTRWATHGGVTVANAHPHTSCHDRVVVVHNGIVENFTHLRRRLTNHHLKSETDTELIAHLIEEKLNHHLFPAAAVQAFKTLQGYNTVVSLSPPTQEIVALKHGSPLVVGRTADGYLLSSDIPALLSFTRQIYALKDGEGVYLSPQKAFLINLKNPSSRQPLPFQVIKTQSHPSSSLVFSHHLLQEIYDQIQVIKNISNLPLSTFTPLLNLITSSSRLFLTGCGTAGYAALAGRYLLASAGFQADFAVASQFTSFAHLLNSHSLLLALSQSGETLDTLEAVRLAKKQQAKTAAMVNVPASTLTQEVDYTLYLSAGRERAVVSTKAYTAKLAMFLLLASALKSKKAFTQTQTLLAQTADQLPLFFTPAYTQKLKDLSARLASHSHLFVIGKNHHHPTALETALKIKESSYLHAEGFPAGELKHGVIALIETGTPCLVIDDGVGEIISSAMELKARGAFIIGISPQKHQVFDYHLKIPNLPQTSLIHAILPGQLLGAYLALARGFNPDMPRNLAKSVTVK